MSTLYIFAAAASSAPASAAVPSAGTLAGLYNFPAAFVWLIEWAQAFNTWVGPLGGLAMIGSVIWMGNLNASIMERLFRLIWCGLAMTAIANDWLLIHVIYQWGTMWSDTILPHAQSLMTEKLAGAIAGTAKTAVGAAGAGAAAAAIPMVGKGFSAASFFLAIINAAATISGVTAIAVLWLAYTFQKIGLMAAYAFAPAMLALGTTVWARGYAVNFLRSVCALSLFSLTSAMVIRVIMYWMDFIAKTSIGATLGAIPIASSLVVSVSIITAGLMLDILIPLSFSMAQQWVAGAYDFGVGAIGAFGAAIASAPIMGMQAARMAGGAANAANGGVQNIIAAAPGMVGNIGSALQAVKRINPRALLPKGP